MESAFAFETTPGLSGNRVKAGFHCHTINSDGGLSPEETISRYRELNYQCVGITDHRMVNSVKGLYGDNFLALGATENGGDPDIIGVGVDQSVSIELSLLERSAALARQGGFTIAAHPSYCGVLPEAYVECPDLMAMEIYNAYCDAAYANGYATELWDMVLGQGKRIWGVAGDDAHLNPRKRFFSDAGKGWVEIWARELTEDYVLDRLKKGCFFSTRGPVFEEIAVTDTMIKIRCSPVSQVRWRTWGKVGHVEYAQDESALTSAALPDWFCPAKYVRIELVDYDGMRAWSNPIFLKDNKLKEVN